MKQNQTWEFSLRFDINDKTSRISIVTCSNVGGGGGGIARMSILRKTYHFSIAHEIDHHNSFLVISQLVYSLPQLFNDNFCWFITSL